MQRLLSKARESISARGSQDDSDHEPEEATPDLKADLKQHQEDSHHRGGSQPALLPPVGDLTILHRNDTMGSVSSIYSADGGKGKYAVTGQVQMAVWFKDDILHVKVLRARGLAAAKGGGVSDPYIKTYLLPDRTKHTKRKTGIQRHTTSPEYNEQFKNKILRSEIGTRALWLSVWDWDRFGRNKFLGEIRCPLSTMDLTDAKEHWYNLKNKRDQADAINRGRLKVAIKYTPYTSKKTDKLLDIGSLHVSVKSATDLPVMNSSNGRTDASVKLYLLPRRDATKQKTKIIKNNLNPEWNEMFEYKKVSLEDLKSRRVLECSVWDFDVRGCNDFIGCIRLGPDPEKFEKEEWIDSFSEEVKQWEDMLARPGEWVETEHTLRPTIGTLNSSEANGVDDEVATLDDQLDSEAAEQTAPPLGQSPIASIMDTVDRPVSEEDEKASDDDSPYGSKTSLYSETPVRGNYDISGELCVSLEHRSGKLRVTIHSARNLAAADFNGFSDPYVKTYLLPERSKHSKRLTDIKKKTLDPVFEETVLYDVERAQLKSRTLWFTVWDWDRFGKNEFLGEVKVPFSSIDLSDYRQQWHKLQDTDLDNLSSTDQSGRGKLTLALKFETLQTKKGRFRGTLHVHIKYATALPNMDERGLTDGFVKMCLLPDKKNSKKTRVIDDNLDPVWDQRLAFGGVSLDDLSTSHALELTVWDYDRLSSNDFIGGLRLGPSPGEGDSHDWMDSSVREAKHWKEMLSQLGEWVEYSHPLRPSMNPIKRDSTSDSGAATGNSDSGAATGTSDSGAARGNGDSGAATGTSDSSSMVLSRSPRRNRSDRTQSPSSHTSKVDDVREVPQHTDTTRVSSPSSSSPSPFHSNQTHSPYKKHAPPPSRTMSEIPAVSLPASELSRPRVPVQSGASSSLRSQSFIAQGADFEYTYYGGVQEWDDQEEDYIIVMDSQDESGEKAKSQAAASSDSGITGEVLYSVNYIGGPLGLLGLLRIQVERVRGLPSRPKVKTPYLELCLLPNRKNKTTGKQGTATHHFNMVDIFKLSQSDVAVTSLCLRLWDSNKPGRRFLGEINQPLSSHNLDTTKSVWHPLRDKKVDVAS